MYTLETAIEEFKSTWPATAARTGENRIRKARLIAEAQGAIIPTPDQNIYMVRSDSNLLGQYRVDVKEKSCTCPDAGKGNVCKHRLAVWMYIQIREKSQQEAKAGVKRQIEEFRAWKAAHPDSANIDFVDFRTHPHHGTVKYLHPLQGEITVEVLATDAYSGGTRRGQVIHVIALRGNPFSERTFSTYRRETYPARFQPLEA